nr:MAG TPA: hypothetical protein [Caudoviricetes sp.]
MTCVSAHRDAAEQQSGGTPRLGCARVREGLARERRDLLRAAERRTKQRI